jgi:prefoldin beta subunit
MATDGQKQLQALTEQYQSLQSGSPPSIPVFPHINSTSSNPFPPHTHINILPTELSQTLIPARQKLDSQHSENTSVLKSFQSLPASSQIYKAIGPVLLKQDQKDAKTAVEGRIGYVEREIERVEKSIQEVQGKLEGMREGIMGLQAQVQGQQGQVVTGS